MRTGRALTAFEAFGRDVERRFFHLTSRGGFELVASTESSCFGNAFLELLTGPKTEPERLATVAALRTLCDKLLAEGVVSCFAMSASDDVALATAYVFNGFRRTGSSRTTSPWATSGRTRSRGRASSRTPPTS